MKSEVKIIIGVALIFLGLVVWRLQDSKPQNQGDQSIAENPVPAIEGETKPHDHSHDADDVFKAPPPSPLKPAEIKAIEQNFTFSVPTNLPTEQQEEMSLNNYARALYVFSNNEQKPETMVKKLTEAGLKPLVIQDFNEVTGKMIVINTGETLPGTRYFHAQYFEDENKQPFLQHLSFEYKPDLDGLAKAEAAIVKQFPPNIGKIHRCSDSFSAWESGPRTVWCNQFRREEDLPVDDAHRAYSKQDINTTRCAVELNPHPHEDPCGN